jgi:dimethylhistidine N-methyltransferase
MGQGSGSNSNGALPQRPSPHVPRLMQLQSGPAQDVRQELQHGLLQAPAHVAPKFLYDALGSRLFDAITELPEYYPTRTEAAILREHGADIARAVGTGRTLIDLGAGNGEKAARLFASLQPVRYVAVDISADHLARALQGLQREYPAIDMLGLGLDFSQSLDLPDVLGQGPRMLFYPGSSIGNFTPVQSLGFLRQVARVAQGGPLLIGVDLVKPKAVLEAAYDDALGVTAAFNLNLLNQVNRLLGADFNLADWSHLARYDDSASRIEMHLKARRALTVRWPEGERRFERDECLHTENSYKYSVESFDALLRQAGFAQTRCWTDPQRWFAVFVAQAS